MIPTLPPTYRTTIRIDHYENDIWVEEIENMVAACKLTTSHPKGRIVTTRLNGGKV